MRRSAYLLFVAASLLLALRSAVAASRPRYGGTLKVELSAATASLDPAQSSAFLTSTQQELTPLMFDCLVGVDAQGEPQPGLAASWEHDPDYRRWLFHLRSGVLLHIGSPLRPHLVVMSLAASNPSWHLRLQGDDVVIESSNPLPNLLAELACAHNSIVVHTESGAVVGTGAFRVTAWEPGKRLVLAANDDYWGDVRSSIPSRLHLAARSVTRRSTCNWAEPMWLRSRPTRLGARSRMGSESRSQRRRS